MGDELTPEEIATLAKVFPPHRAYGLLRAAGFPMQSVPALPGTATDFWEGIAESLASGVMHDGRRRILAEASRRYPGNETFVRGREPSVRPDRETTVLVVGASPSGMTRIRADREARAVMTAAEGSGLRVEHCPAAAATDLRRILKVRPHFLHLICHGDGESLFFEDVHGEAHRVAAEHVADTLRLYRDSAGIRLRGLVIGSCDSDRVAACFASAAERVVAHRDRLDDACAIAFAGHLYRDLRHAADLGVAARLAAQHTLLTDSTCSTVVNDLVILPN